MLLLRNLRRKSNDNCTVTHMEPASNLPPHIWPQKCLRGIPIKQNAFGFDGKDSNNIVFVFFILKRSWDNKTTLILRPSFELKSFLHDVAPVRIPGAAGAVDLPVCLSMCQIIVSF